MTPEELHCEYLIDTLQDILNKYNLHGNEILVIRETIGIVYKYKGLLA